MPSPYGPRYRCLRRPTSLQGSPNECRAVAGFEMQPKLAEPLQNRLETSVAPPEPNAEPFRASISMPPPSDVFARLAKRMPSRGGV
mmetsp:Transcript_23560/g.54026  ORF Transcript_23560/g.54026 Transcript_23560/m.54026 type:complete len:86 (-) Transcript_23560:34-291(-)